MQDAALTIGAWGCCAARGCAYGLRGFYKLVAAFLALVALLAPSVAVSDGICGAA